MQRLRDPLYHRGVSGRLSRVYTLIRRLTGPERLLRGRPDAPNSAPPRPEAPHA